MKTKILLFIVLLFSLYTNAQNWEWAKAEPNDVWGNSSADYDDAHHSAVDALGNLYVLGDYADSLWLNGVYRTKGNGSYIAKYSAGGSLLWYKLITSYDNLYGSVVNATSLTVNASGVFITGMLPQASPPMVSYQYVIGNSSYTVDTSSYDGRSYLYGNQFFLCRLNSSGNVVWNKTSRRAWIGSGLSKPVLTTDKNNNVIISGVIYRQYCCGDFEVNKTFYLGNDAITDNYAFAHNFRVFAIKYNSAGTRQWNSFAHTKGGTIQDPDFMAVLSSVTDSSNNIWLYTQLYNEARFGNITFSTPNTNFGEVYGICKLSASGNWTVVKEVSTYQTIPLNKNHMLTTDAGNNVYVLSNLNKEGYLNSNIHIPNDVDGMGQNPEMYLLKYNATGNLLWYKNFGGTRGDAANGIVYKNNSLYLTGYVRSVSPAAYTMTFPPLTVNDEFCNYYDVRKYFIAKADTAGSFIFVNLLCPKLWAEGFSVSVDKDNIYTTGSHYNGVLNLGSLTPGQMDDNFPSSFTGKLKDQYIRVGAVTPTALCPGSNITIPFTSYGLVFSNKNKFTAEISDVNGEFNTNTIVIGNITATGSGSLTATLPSSLQYGNTYRVRIQSSDTLKTGYNYYAYADTPYKITVLCPAPSSGFAATNITSNSATLKWNTVDCGKGYKVQYRVKGAAAWTTILVNSNTGSALLTGLSANTIYQWRVSTKCKPSTVVYSDFSAIKTFTTKASFAVNSLSADNIAVQTKPSSLKLYPNPANDFVTVQFNAIKTGNYILELTDVSGKILQTKKGSISYGENKVIIDISRYANGTYFINLTNDESGKQTLSMTKK